jgi:uncharacterized protein (DUF362 family)
MSRNEHVYVYDTSPKRLRETVSRALDSPYCAALDPQKRTYLKINGNHDKEYPGSNTSRWFLDALLSGLKDHGFRDISVIEGAGYLFSATQMVKSTRLLEICARHNVPFIDYEDLERDQNGLPQLIHGGQLINVPIMHTHGYAVVSCASKNYFGLIPKNRWIYHERLNEKLLELYDVIPATIDAVSIVEGTVGQRGDSTRTGDPIKLDLVLVGKDTLAVDTVVSRIMGFSPDEIPLLKHARTVGRMDFDISLAGDYASIDALPHHDFRFERSTAKQTSIWLHQHPVTKYFIERQPFRGAFHKAREVYQDYIYYKKRGDLFSGEWMEYERELSGR